MIQQSHNDIEVTISTYVTSGSEYLRYHACKSTHLTLQVIFNEAGFKGTNKRSENQVQRFRRSALMDCVRANRLLKGLRLNSLELSNSFF